MLIRKATADDLPILTAIEAECFPPAEAADEATLARRLAVYHDHFWLLFEGNTAVGFVDGMVTDDPNLRDEMYEDPSLHDENGAWQMIFGLNTIPSCRRRGYAASLMRHVIAEARAQGRQGLVLTCKDHLIHYYAGLGFVNEGLSPSTHGDAVWYQMRLTF